MKVTDLKGFKGWRAFNVFHKLMLGVKMLPMYAAESYEDFFARVEAMPDSDKEKVIRQASIFVDLDEDEIIDIISCCEDSNGIALGRAQLKSMSHDMIFECVVAVATEISKIKVNFVSDTEKKN